MIVKMRKLSAVCSKEHYRKVLKKLYSLGCVELESADNEVLEKAGGLLSLEEVDTGSSDAKQITVSALKTLDRYAPCKTSFLAPRDPLTEDKLFDEKIMEEAYRDAGDIKSLSDKLDENNASILKAESRIAALKPWEGLDVPLDYEGSKCSVFAKGVMPCEVDVEKVKEDIEKEFPVCDIRIIASDKEQHYVAVFCYRPSWGLVADRLKSEGFVTASLYETKGTAGENIQFLKEQINNYNWENERLVSKIQEWAPKRKLISASYDAFSQEKERDELASSLGKTKKTVLLSGWVPEEREKEVKDLFKIYNCAWEFSDPTEEDNVPVTYKTNKFSQAFVGITEMYGTPSYNSIVDPNPLMSIFYFAFFGFMMGDAMYGILITLGAYLFLKLKRPSGTMKNMLKMFMYCGVSTFIAGVLTGGWFADSVAAVSFWLTGTAVSIPPLWFDPLQEPMTMLTFSLVLGVIQIVAGMALAGYRMVKKGHPLDAVFDIVSWWILFAGLGIFAMGKEWGIYVALVGVAIILLTGGRDKKGFGKITGGFGALYGITSYVSDLLSYSRIMALGLSGAVVGQVVNKIATMSSGFMGIILFVFVFILGHTFNIASSLLGAYVHSSRLQYIEFFGKFLDDGGRAFKPLVNKTKYVEIIKEEN